MSEKLYLLDASGYIFRAYYAIRSLSNSKGLPTNALYGFTSMLMKLIKEEQPDHFAAVFDVARKTFRNEKYPAYKANRSEPPADLVPQFPYFRKIVQAMNIPVLELPNYEADDVIGTLTHKLRDYPTVIVTADKDMMQLVSQRVTLLDSMKEKRIGIPEVKERFGVGPELVADILGLAGDSSDNIPGVPGIGEKTAIKLVLEYGSLDGVLKNAAHIKGKMGENIRTHADQALLSRELATIQCDCPIPYDFKDFQLTEPDPDALRELFTELEFNRFLTDMAPRKTLSSKQYHLVTHRDDLQNMVKKLVASEVGFALDTETTSVDPMQARLVGLSFSCRPGEAYYVPVGHHYEGIPTQLSWEEVVRPLLKPILEDPKIAKQGQNIKYDLTVLARHGVHVQGVTTDTMVASYLLTPETQHNLERLAQVYLDHKVTTYDEVVGTGKKKLNFSQIPLEQARDYSCEDADVTFRLVDILRPKLKEAGLETLFEALEMPLLLVLTQMEQNGIKVDVALLQQLSKDYEKKLVLLEGEIHRAAGEEFNINSPKQLGNILFDKMKLPVIRKTKTGYSTDYEVLSELAKRHEVPRLVLDYRSLSKLKSTYLDALPELVHPETGRLHTSFNQTVAATGRLSSSDPNLQNIPIRSDDGRRIREAFVAEPGCVLVSADYSQIELRLLAHLSKDPVLLEAFATDQDVHRATAANLYGVSEAQVSSEMRAVAKTVNFGIMYGQGAYGLSQQLGIHPKEAQEYIDLYHKRYQRVIDYKEQVLKAARQHKQVHTLMGRLRNFPEIDSPNNNIRAFAERTAFNTIFQGSAADIIKQAMIEIQQVLNQHHPKTKLLLQVHDELVLEVPEGEVEVISKLVKDKMEGAMKLSVPLKVDLGVGPNWSQAH